MGSSNNIITVVSPYKLVAYGLARELSIRFRHNGGISFCHQISACTAADIFILYFSTDTDLLSHQLASLKAQFASAKVVILLDDIAFDVIASLAAIGFNAIISRHDDIQQLEKKLRLLLSHQVEYCPLYLPKQGAYSQQFNLLLTRLTKRELGVLALASYGLNDNEIAQAIDNCIGSIKNSLSIIYDKMGVTNRLEALAFLQSGK